MAGDALSVFREAWGTLAADRLPELRGGAGDIARLARIDFGRGRAVAAAEAIPLYVRDRVALTIDERRQKAVNERARPLRARSPLGGRRSGAEGANERTARPDGIATSP